MESRARPTSALECASLRSSQPDKRRRPGGRDSARVTFVVLVLSVLDCASDNRRRITVIWLYVFIGCIRWWLLDEAIEMFCTFSFPQSFDSSQYGRSSGEGGDFQTT